MSARKVKLYIRIRTSEERDVFAEPVWNRNRTLRGGYAQVAGQPTHHPEGVYYLRYVRAGRRSWHAVGTSPEIAVAAQRNAEHDLEAMALGRSVQALAVSAETMGTIASTKSLQTAVDEYLEEVRRFRAPKTISACENMLGRFAARYLGRSVCTLTRKDLLDHMTGLKKDGLGDRSIFNHIARITTFLKASSAENLLRASDWPRYDQKEVSAYSSEQLASLFAATQGDDRELFQFFLATGFREQEVEYISWANIDFNSKVISLWSKAELGFKLKDNEERSVPVPDSLIRMLDVRRQRGSSMLIFPARGGKPDGHFLRRLQLAAFRAGLNCGECVTRSGKECGSSPVCGAWGLHKFRKTYATMHAEAGVSPPTIQRWLGHSDLTTTMRYLAISDMRSERTRQQVNAAFAGVTGGGAA